VGDPTPTDAPTRLAPLAALFRALGDEHRLHILALLSDHPELSVSAIGGELGQSQPAVSHHLRELRAAGLIDFRRAGKFNLYRLDPAGIAAAFDRLSPAGPARLALGGVEVTARRM
jgi:DNA-binding transcriptional ArsR family regulator